MSVQALSRRFGGVKAVDDVSIAIPRGEFHAVIGSNGAGKTTLFNLITGSLRPTSGSVCVEGRDITRLPPHRRARLGIGRTFQINNVFLSKTVAANIRIAIVARERGIWNFFADATARHRDEIEQIAHATGLGEQVDRAAATLSYGDRRRLELAIALAGKPQLLLLDEPTCGMSSSDRPALVALIRSLVSSRGMTAILVEHDMDVVFSVAQRITVMHRGRLLAQGTPADIAAHPEVRRIYLGSAHG